MARTFTPLEDFLKMLMVHRNHRGVKKGVPSNLVDRYGRMEDLESGLVSIRPLHEYHYKKYHLFQETDAIGNPVDNDYGKFHEKKITKKAEKKEVKKEVKKESKSTK